MNRDATRQPTPYGTWESPLNAETVFAGTEQIAFLQPGEHGLFFLLAMPAQDNHQSLMYLGDDGRLVRVSPPGVNIRSRVHEYGGLPYAVTRDRVLYCSDSHQQSVLIQHFDENLREPGECRTLISSDGALRFADFIVDRRRNRVICVREDHRGGARLPTHSLVAVDLEQGGAGKVLFESSDFVASPQLDVSGERLAFQTWNLPDMPWDNTLVHVAELNDAGEPASVNTIRREKTGSLTQPLFTGGGDLLFVADWSDWWNLYRVAADDLSASCKAEPIFPVEAECCGPQWQLGIRHYTPVTEKTVLACLNRGGRWDLALLDLCTGRWRAVMEGLAQVDNVVSRAGRAYCIAQAADASPQILSLPVSAGGDAERLYRCASPALAVLGEIASPEHISCATGDGEEAHGYFYPPCNPAACAPEGSAPPLLVNVHGGPTSCARTGFDPQTQFWTSRGFAVLDVNHRGSTGYGRHFRHRLYGQWGAMDVEDTVCAVRHLVESGRVSADKVAIRGKSAGGYVVLAALARNSVFSAGVSYYGVSDLELLAADTHKFESRYLDKLIGPYPEARDLYRARSPIHHIDRITAPVLLLQGLEDRVVPPNQTQRIYGLLQQQNPDSECIEFPEEGHGFRTPANQIRALEAELAFYQRNLLAAAPGD